jgi:membrane fusion protein (multidrug efflux system)
MRMRRSPAALVLAGLASILSCGRAERPREKAPAPPVTVRTARVGGGSGSWVDVPGSVEAARAADIASRVSAVVDSVAVEEGAFVRAGDLLVRLDGRDLMARLAAAEAGLQAATAQRDRMRELFVKDAATQQEKDGAEAGFASALAERDATKAQIEYVEFRAPFDGFIVNKRTRAGDLAIPGQPLLTVQGAGLLRVTATVTRSQADRLKPGQPIDAVLEGGTVVPSRLSVLAPAGDPSSLRFLVKADLPKGSGARVGSFARLRLPRGDEESAPMVPRAAIVERGALSGVYVVEDGRARLRWISLGEPAGDLVLVRAGLSAGDEIVLEPGPLDDGAVVERRP